MAEKIGIQTKLKTKGQKMNALMIAPTEWTRLKDIDDVKPVNNEDADCLIEIRDVLKKHGKIDRFGVALLHSHFELASDEIMLESSGSEDRSLITKAVKQSEAGNNNVGTIWMLSEGDVTAMSWCRKYCKQRWFGHDKNHNTVPGK